MSALTYIPNQPILFKRPNETECLTCEEYKHYQLIDKSDISQVQFKVQPCGNSINVQQDWNNYNLGFGWSNYFGALRKVATNSFSLALLSGIIAPNTNYFVEVSIREINGTLDLRFNTAQQLLNGVGLHRFVINSSNSQQFDFQIFMQGNSQTVTIDYINIYSLGENFIFSIHDKDGNHQAEINTFDNPSAFVFAEDTVTVSIDWNSLNLPDGCYQIRYSDPCVNTCGQNGIVNGGFANNSGWQLFTSNNRLRIINGKLQFNNVGADYAQNAATLCDGVQYKITWELEVFNNAQAFIRIGTATGTIRNSTGTYIDVITANGSNFDIVVEDAGGVGRPLAFIDNVKLELVDKSEIVPQLESNWFEYGEHDCTLMINACNSNDGLGFIFGNSGFTPRLRIDGTIVNAQYDLSRDTILSSIGKKDVYFGRRRKNKELRVPLSPEYYHDFLSLLPLFNNVYINNKKYAVDSDGYELDYNSDLPNFSTATINISEKTQHIETNNAKVKNVGGCQLPPNYLLLVQGNQQTDFVNDMEQDEPILINE